MIAIAIGGDRAGGVDPVVVSRTDVLYDDVMSTVVEQLNEALGALEASGLDDVGDAELHGLAMSLQRAHARLGVVAGRVLAVWESRGIWSGDQSIEPVGPGVNCSPARKDVAQPAARRPPGRRGGVGWCVVAGSPRLLASARGGAGAVRRRRDVLVEQCAGLRFRQAAQAVAYWKQRANAEHASDDHDEQTAAAALYASETFEGTVIINGTLDPIGGHGPPRRVAPARRQATVG